MRPRRHLPALLVVVGLVLVGTQCTPAPPRPTVAVGTGYVVVDGPGGQTDGRSVVVSNDGAQPIKLTMSEGSPHFRLEYAVSQGSCGGHLNPDGMFLQPGATCFLLVRFDPLSASDDHRTTLVVTATPGGTSEVVFLGRGYEAAPGAAPVASVG